jgi:hypothetical protein
MASTKDAWEDSQKAKHRKEQDRRDTCRYPAVTRNAVLSWDIGGSPVEYPVELENISMRGCLVRSRKLLSAQPGQAVRIALEDLESAAPIQGMLVSAVKPFLRRQIIRVRFVDPLPFLAFKMLVYGPEALDLEQRERPDHETDQFWR